MDAVSAGELRDADWDDARIEALMRPEIPPALEAEVLDVLRTWPTVWTAVDSETCSAVREAALSRLYQRGLLECRIRFGVAGQSDWAIAICGPVTAQQIAPAVQDATSLEWSQVVKCPQELRLSEHGQYAKDSLASSTGKSWVVTWIFWDKMHGPAAQFVRVERMNEPSSENKESGTYSEAEKPIAVPAHVLNEVRNVMDELGSDAKSSAVLARVSARKQTVLAAMRTVQQEQHANRDASEVMVPSS